jgi:hypothetical protein
MPMLGVHKRLKFAAKNAAGQLLAGFANKKSKKRSLVDLNQFQVEHPLLEATFQLNFK